MYEFLAKIVLLIHLLFIFFVVFGAFSCLISNKFFYLHLMALSWGIYIEFTSSICPLTYLENWLLIRDQASFYDDGFIENYILKIIYPKGITPDVQMILGFLLIILNVWFYALVFYFKFVKKKLNSVRD
tara:strand:+ start:187 stop:573 length:387 start_codon:yes stop_codon:yes gene_type:complete